MEVTRSNFIEQLPEIETAIKDATFLAVDGEFTGLNDTDPAGNSSPLDLPEERYNKLRKNASNFLLVQFGLCAFKYDERTKKYEAKPFNFYIFPRPYMNQAPDRRFLCQSSSLAFLASKGFDFNKLIHEGISYLTPVQEQNLRQAITNKHTPASPDSAANPSASPVPIPPDQKDFVERMCEKIGDFLASEEKGPLQLSPCTSFQRKLLYQAIPLKYKNVFLETQITEDKKDRYLVVSRVSGEEEYRDRELRKLQLELDQLDEAVGFNKVIKLICASGKLLVGHNMLLDVMHIVNQFHLPLPDTFDDFKAVVKCITPRLIDTKLMASMYPFKEYITQTALGELQKILGRDPFNQDRIEMAPGFEAYSTQAEQLHEAGYDAYVTGLCFISLSRFLASQVKPPLDYMPPTAKYIEPFINKLFLMRSIDIPYINLNGADDIPDRSHIFHITFPKEWKTGDIINLFSPYGNVQVVFQSDTTAFVILHNRNNASSVLKGLPYDASRYQVITYGDFKKRSRAEGFTTPVRSMVNKRQLCAQDVEAPTKRLRSLNADAEPFVSRQLKPIPEAPEAEEAAKCDLPEKPAKPAPAPASSRMPELPQVKPSPAVQNKVFKETDAW